LSLEDVRKKSKFQLHDQQPRYAERKLVTVLEYIFIIFLYFTSHVGSAELVELVIVCIYTLKVELFNIATQQGLICAGTVGYDMTGTYLEVVCSTGISCCHI